MDQDLSHPLPQALDLGVVSDHLASDWLSDLDSPLEGPELIRLGAVYVNRERIQHDIALAHRDHVRIHRKPRRFPVPPKLAIVSETSDFWVLLKPHGLPVHPTCDNARENLLSLFSQQTGLPVYLCHRLDIPTGGLIVVAKSQMFQRQFHRWLADRNVGKWYEAQVDHRVPVGPQAHYMEPHTKGTKTLSHFPRPGWKHCEMEIENCRWTPQGWSVRIRLITGRHHQIRAQLASLGAPIRGDSDYGGCSLPLPGILLRCIRLQFCGFNVSLPDLTV